MDQIQRFRGVLSLAVLLLVVYGIEFGLALTLGFPDPRTMLTVPSMNEKRVIALAIGPILHQSNSHLFENLVYLVIYGSYIEWYIGWRRFLKYSMIVGYGATLLLLVAGSVGAVGASSITNGLAPIMGFIGLVQIARGLQMVQDTSDIVRTAVHSVPFVIGIGFAVMTIQTGLITGISTTEAIHALGALIGLFLGLWHFSISFRETNLLATFIGT